jgi:hypothetical protein
MKRSILILTIDTIAFISFIFLTSTGVLLHYLLPPGSGRWSSIWGISRHEWGDIHYLISVIFFSVLALHLILHWKVIINLIKGRQKKVFSLRLALSPLLSPTVETENNNNQPHHGRIK